MELGKGAKIVGEGGVRAVIGPQGPTPPEGPPVCLSGDWAPGSTIMTSSSAKPSMSSWPAQPHYLRCFPSPPWGPSIVGVLDPQGASDVLVLNPDPHRGWGDRSWSPGGWKQGGEGWRWHGVGTGCVGPWGCQGREETAHGLCGRRANLDRGGPQSHWMEGAWPMAGTRCKAAAGPPQPPAHRGPGAEPRLD